MKLRNKETGEIEKAYITMNEDRIAVIVADMPLCGNSVLGEYDSLAELNEEWEDYAPKEPLIKDEKIRKAVRAWADATGTKSVNYWGHLESCQNDAEIEFDQPLGFENGDDYTIAELCGEEEE